MVMLSAENLVLNETKCPYRTSLGGSISEGRGNRETRNMQHQNKEDHSPQLKEEQGHLSLNEALVRLTNRSHLRRTLENESTRRTHHDEH